MKRLILALLPLYSAPLSLFCSAPLCAEDVERPRPAEWEGLVHGGRLMDRFLPLPSVGQLTTDTWGDEGVKPRHVDNGLEAADWSYWGGNIHVGDDGQYHLFVCRWREDDPKGHMAWPRSEVVRAISDSSAGPFKVADVIGPGHNPEMQRLRDGRYFLNVNKYYYLADNLAGPWQRHSAVFDSRQREIVQHMANNTFAKREDGSMLMVGRGGGVWISETGVPPYRLVSMESIYPRYEGRYEDPVVWRTNVQYHLVVNDWYGRVAYYMRSPDGIRWKLDAGEAYKPGIARHADGRVEQWYKFERIKVLQDQHGRAYQANFAVCDAVKRQDLASDNHSSKNLSIPMTVGRLLQLMGDTKIDESTEQVRLLVKAEPDFNPHEDIDLKSLRFGASEEVDFGRGCKLRSSEPVGSDLVLVFDGKGNGLTKDNFAAKLLGKTSDGQLLFGFARLPWLTYAQPYLSAKYPELSRDSRRLKAEIEIENFGIAASQQSTLRIEVRQHGNWRRFAETSIPSLEPYQRTTVTCWGFELGKRNEVAELRVTISRVGQEPSILEGPVVIR